MSLRPPQGDIDLALGVERELLSLPLADNYREFIKGHLMTDRTTDQELRDGCILVHLFNRTFNQPPGKGGAK